MSDYSQSDNDAPMQLSIKRNDKKQKIIQKPKKKIVDKKQKAKIDLANQLKKQIKADLQRKFQQDKILQQLKNIPINLQQRQNKVVKIQDTKVQKKSIKSLGIQVVQQIKRQIRKPDQKLKLKLDLNNRNRGGIDHIVAFKRGKR